MPYTNPEDARRCHHKWYLTHKAQVIEAATKWKKQHPEASHKSSKEHYQRLKLRVFEMLGGAKCVYCGCTDIRMLEVNHINGGGERNKREQKRNTRIAPFTMQLHQENEKQMI